MSENTMAGNRPPRHRDKTRFGRHGPDRKWTPFEVTEGKLLFACGHSGRVVVGSTPEKPEKEVKEFLQKVAGKPCAACQTMPTRLRSFQTTEDEGKKEAPRRAKD